MSVALQGLMPNYVKVVPSIAIAFVSYEQVNVLLLGLQCKRNAASASDGISRECDANQHGCSCKIHVHT